MKIKGLFAWLLLCALLLICSCAPAATPPPSSNIPQNGAENEEEPKETAPTRAELQEAVDLLDEGAVLPLADHRVLLTSDTHYTYLQTWYGVTPEKRMQAWVDAILYEHSLRPFDLIVIIGDTSLDHWKWNGGGSYIKDGVTTTKAFMENYVSQLPQDVPVFVLAGNHEQFGNEKWREITGNDRQGSFVLGDNLFLFLDSFSAELDPNYHHDGYATAPDAEYIRAEMEKYPEHTVYLISHYFHLDMGGDEFAEIVSDPRVVTLFQGHTHKCAPIELGEEYGNKQILETGNFSYTSQTESAQSMIESFWGFRDLVLVGPRAVSRYIVAQSEAIVKGALTQVPRQLCQVVELNR